MIPIRCIDRKPKKAGEYCISITGIRTLAPLWMKFDGEDWVWDSYATVYGKEAIYWYPRETD